MRQQRAERQAILAPGGGYGVDAPLLMFAGLAVERRGGRTRPVAWDLSGEPDFAGQRRHVLSRVEAAIDEVVAETGAAPVIIGKSLGSLAAPLAADRGLAAVWFTPLLDDEPTVVALRRATAPCLLAGGTADEFWDGQVARSVTTDVVEIDGADHWMFVPGPLAASAAALGQVITAVEDFLDRIVWP